MKPMRILTISDSFKGTLRSAEIGQIVSDYCKEKGYAATYIPISDGGEGFLETVHYITKLPFHQTEVNDPLFQKTTAKYLFDDAKQIAYLELAEACGITKIKTLSPIQASTYGLGELMMYVINKHAPKKMILGIGGSATSDMGAGMLEACGVNFLDAHHFRLSKMNHAKLMQIRKIETKGFLKKIKHIEFVTLTDVANCAFGQTGCIKTFAPQKGAKEEDLFLMEKNVLHFHHVTQDTFGTTIQDFPGAGAAGGVGYTMKHYFGSRIQSGIEVLLDLVDFSHLVQENDIVITGEGAFDEQSLNGKVISGIWKHHPKRLIVLCGKSEFSNPPFEVYPIVPKVASFEEAIAHPQASLKQLLDMIPFDQK
ncbi:MAG: glycerate kinase [Prevotella sp.]|nr:glycerate kinase [Staphylococcus sp.]MCM1350443.1 glycerate kinase [Prevotella sp.]